MDKLFIIYCSSDNSIDIGEHKTPDIAWLMYDKRVNDRILIVGEYGWENLGELVQECIILSLT